MYTEQSGTASTARATSDYRERVLAYQHAILCLAPKAEKVNAAERGTGTSAAGGTDPGRYGVYAEPSLAPPTELRHWIQQQIEEMSALDQGFFLDAPTEPLDDPERIRLLEELERELCGLPAGGMEQIPTLSLLGPPKCSTKATADSLTLQTHTRP